MKNLLKVLSAIVLLFTITTNLKAQNVKFYEQKWEEIDSLEDKGLPKSALKVVDKIYTKAKKTKTRSKFLNLLYSI